VNVDGGGALEAVFNVFELVVSGEPVDVGGDEVGDGHGVEVENGIVDVSVGVIAAIVLQAVSIWAAFALGVDEDSVTL